MNWGHYIIGSFFAFAVVIFSLVTISMKQDVNLVADDYYKQEIAYQEEINKISNYNRLKEKPLFKLNRQSLNLEVSFPSNIVGHQQVEGKIQLFRPSRKTSDKFFRIELTSNGKQSISLLGLNKGLWRAKINFTIDRTPYYHEQNIIL